MKKILLFLLLIILVSCELNNDTECDCDRVTKIISRTDNINYQWSGVVETKNECTGIIRNYEFHNVNPKIGWCFTKQ